MRLPSTVSRARDLDPFDAFRRNFDDMVADFGRWPMADWASGAKSGLAALDVAETKDAIEVSAELPGVAENEIQVTVEGQALVIAGEKKSETDNRDKAWRVMERTYGAFRRVVPLTFAPDATKVSATFEKGVLHVRVGKPSDLVAQKVSIPVAKAH